MKPIKYKPIHQIWHTVRVASKDAEYYIRVDTGSSISRIVSTSINSVRNESN